MTVEEISTMAAYVQMDVEDTLEGINNATVNDIVLILTLVISNLIEKSTGEHVGLRDVHYCLDAALENLKEQ